MKRVFFLVFVLVVIAAVAFFLQRSFLDEPEVATSPEEEVAGHMLKNINLVQGKDGVQLWRLKAAWGTMQQADGLVSLELPDIIYYLQPDNEEVHITAKKGEVQQDQNIVRLWDDVTALYEGNRLNAARMDYSTESHIMVFDQGATITGETMRAEAGRLEWDTEGNIIYGSDGVKVVYTPSAAPSNGPPPGPELP